MNLGAFEYINKPIKVERTQVDTQEDNSRNPIISTISRGLAMKQFDKILFAHDFPRIQNMPLTMP